MNEQRQRTAFEAFMRSHDPECRFDRFDKNDKLLPGDYRDWQVRAAWPIWLAAVAHMTRTTCNRS